MMDICEAECTDDTSIDEMQEGVSDRKDDKNKKYDQEKESECPDDTSSVDIEEGVGDKKDGRSENNDEVKEAE